MSGPTQSDDRARAAWGRIEGWYAANAEPLLDGLRPGASEEALTRAEAQLGVSLPAGLRSVYRVHDGGWIAPFVEDELLSLARIVEMRAMMGRVHEMGVAQGWVVAGGAHPFWSFAWIPFVGTSSFLCVDTGTSYGDPPGQVVVFHKGQGGGGVASPSILDWLEGWADVLARDTYYYDEDAGALVLCEHARGGS